MSTGKRKEFQYFAAKLEELRGSKVVTQAVLAEAIGTSQPTVRAWLAGTSGPNIAQLIDLANFFRVATVDEMIRALPHGDESRVVRKRVLLELLKNVEKTTQTIEQILSETGPVKKSQRKQGPRRNKRRIS